MKKIVIAAAVMLLGFVSVQADGTAANTDINNSVTLSYKVSGTTQTTVDATDTGFKVDRKIDIYVDTASTPVDVAPGAQDQNISFYVVNQGNDIEDYNLTVDSTIAGDDFDPSSCTLSASTLPAGASFNVATGQLTDMPIDGNATIVVTCNIPAAGTPHVVDDDNGTISLTAVIDGRTNDSGIADDPAVVQNVFADGTGTDDGNYDGTFSDRGTYHVKSADLTASKTSCVTDTRAFNSANPKRIPGATIRYAIQVNNTGSADATDVSTTDHLKTQLTYSAAYIREETCDCSSPSGTANEGDATTSNSGQDVTLNFGTISAGNSECAYIDATIN
jgi:uncharacterized repeat protein (TIGR01451 family)